MSILGSIVIIIIILVVAILAIGTNRFVGYCAKFNNTRFNKVKFTKYQHDLKDGDVVLFIARVHNLSNSVFTNSLFSHSGMVVKVDGELMISESNCGKHIDSDGKITHFPNGSQLQDLEWRFEEYPGQLFIMPLKDPLTKKQQNKLHSIIHKQTNYPGSVKEVFMHVVNPHRAEQTRHCMQHVNWLIDQIGLHPQMCDFDNDNHKKCRKCKDLFKAGIFNTANQLTSYIGKSMGSNDNTYEPIVEMVYDNF